MAMMHNIVKCKSPKLTLLFDATSRQDDPT